jgi:hypothetical protein
MLPETLCLADLGLGHDERAKVPQPVRDRLGPRFLPWQEEATPEESWEECERHARYLLGDEGFEALQEQLLQRQADAVDAASPTAHLPAVEVVPAEDQVIAVAGVTDILGVPLSK